MTTMKIMTITATESQNIQAKTHQIKPTMEIARNPTLNQNKPQQQQQQLQQQQTAQTQTPTDPMQTKQHKIHQHHHDQRRNVISQSYQVQRHQLGTLLDRMDNRYETIMEQ